MTTWHQNGSYRAAGVPARRYHGSRPRRRGRRLLVVVTLLAVAIGGGVAAWLTLPQWYPGWMPSQVGRAAFPLAHTAVIREAAARRDLDPALVAAVIYTESGFDEQVKSPSGAIGLMQIMPSTAAEIARMTEGYRFRQADLDTPRVNILYGCYLLRVLLDRYHGSVVESLAAYNAGPGNVDSWIAARGGAALRVSDLDFAETRAYVAKVLRFTSVYRDVYGPVLGH